MAFASIIIAMPVAFASALLWIGLKGGSLLGFLLAYAVAGQIVFGGVMLALLLADWLRRHRCNSLSGHKTTLDKPA